MKNYGECLREIRISAGKTLLEVEKETGISNQNLSRWERGIVIPNVDFCVQLSNFYGVTLEELLGLEDNPITPRNHTPALSKPEKELLSLFNSLSEPGKDTVMVAAKNAARFENKGSIHKRA